MTDAGGPRALVARAMAGDVLARADLVATLMPTVRARVARTYAWRRRSVVNDVDDLVQEAFAMLFRDGGRALVAWDPDRGLPFLAFVGLLTERAVGMTLRARHGDREEPAQDDAIADDTDAEDRLAARDELRRLLERARARLTGTGWSYLTWLVLEHRPVQDIARATGTTPDAIYTWNARIKRLLHEIRGELADQCGAPIRRAAGAR